MKDKAKAMGEGLGTKSETIADPRKVEKPKRWRAYVSVTTRAVLAAGKAQAKKDKAAGIKAIKNANAKAAIEASRRAKEDEAKPGAAKMDFHEKKRLKNEAKRLERERADMTRGSALARLLIAGRIDDAMFAAGAHMRQLWLAMDGRGVPALDMTLERVDGGKVGGYGFAKSSPSAERDLIALIEKSGMGDEAAVVLMMVCLMDMMPSAIAFAVEQDEKLKAQNTCSRETQAIVRHLMRGGLTKAWAVINRRRVDQPHIASMRDWLRRLEFTPPPAKVS